MLNNKVGKYRYKGIFYMKDEDSEEREIKEEIDFYDIMLEAIKLNLMPKSL